MNWKTIAGLALIAALIAGVTACNGYALADFVKVQTPEGVQEVTGAPAKVRLSQAPFVRQRYVDSVKSNLAEFDKNTADAQLFADFVGGLLNTGLELAEGPLSGVPLGGVIFAGLGGLIGLYTNKPGTAKREKEIVNQTWDEAVRETLATLGSARNINTSKPDPS